MRLRKRTTPELANETAWRGSKLLTRLGVSNLRAATLTLVRPCELCPGLPINGTRTDGFASTATVR